MRSNNISEILPGSKILFANFPGDGHFNPLTGLAMHLKDMGCDIRWYTAEKYRAKLERLQIPFFPFRKAFDISAGDVEDVFPERKNHKGKIAKLKFDLVNVFILRSPEYYEDVQEIYQEFPFELMIADVTFGAVPFVKEKMNIPVISIGVIPLVETSKDLAPVGLGIMPSSSFIGRLRQAALRLVADRIIFAESTRIMRNILARHGINSGRNNIFDILVRKSTTVLQSGTPGFEYARTDMSPHIHFAGPLLPYTQARQSKRWYNDKLKQYENVLLITQGTVERDIEKLIVPALEAFKNSNCLVIVTTGGTPTEELRRRFPEENIIIEEFIPFDDVMPYADVYLTNGGYGGVLLSIKHGIPMVVAGVHEGKNEINARIGYFGLGVNLDTEKPAVLQIRKAVEEVLGNDRYTKNIKKLRQEFSEYDGNFICAQHAAALLQKRRRPSREKLPQAQLESLIY